MNLHLTSCHKPLVAQVTFVGFVAGVLPHMQSQPLCGDVTLTAHGALVGLGSRVEPLVSDVTGPVSKAHATRVTFVRFLPGVYACVTNKSRKVTEGLATMFTRVWLGSAVC